MPPSPRIKVELNEDLFLQLCEYMKLDPVPDITFKETGEAGKTYGLCKADGRSIIIYHGLGIQLVDGLRFVATEMISTILHELRHVHQIQTWGEKANDSGIPYTMRLTELDANMFARDQQHRWRGLVRLRRHQHGSGFSKLSRHDRHRKL
jgi:hypothetical protein